jgi:hypothetical protein
VSTAAKATATVAAYALGMKHLTSRQQPPEVQQDAIEQCIQTLNGASFLSPAHRQAIKKAWCGSTAVGGTLDQIGLLIQTVCSGQEKCLANLQKTMESIMKSLGKKLTVNFQPLCAVLITLFKESIESYCEANGFTGNTAIVAKGPPSKGGNGTKLTSGAKPPSPHFLAGLWARVQSAIEKIWSDCTNPFIRFINPTCAVKSGNPAQGNKKQPQKQKNLVFDEKTQKKSPNFKDFFVRVGICEGISFYIPLDQKANIDPENWTDFCNNFLVHFKNNNAVSEIVFTKALSQYAGKVFINEPKSIYVNIKFMPKKGSSVNFEEIAPLLAHESAHCLQLTVYEQCTSSPMSSKEKKILWSIIEAGAVLEEIKKSPTNYINKIISFNNVTESQPVPSQCLSNFQPGPIPYLCAALILQYFTNIYNKHKLVAGLNARGGDLTIKLIQFKAQRNKSKSPPTDIGSLIVEFLTTQTNYFNFQSNYTVKDLNIVEERINQRLVSILNQHKGQKDLKALRDALCNDPFLPKLAYCQ